MVKQKTAYEMLRSLVGSEMCIRDRKMPVGQKFMLLAPIVRGRKGEYKKDLADLQKQGLSLIHI